MNKVASFKRLQRLIAVKQLGLKSRQFQLYEKRRELDQQLVRLELYRDEYVKVMLERKIAPLQLNDTRSFLTQLEVSIEDTKLALNSQLESEEALNSLACLLNSQEESIERRLELAILSAYNAEDNHASSVVSKSVYSRKL